MKAVPSVSFPWREMSVICSAISWRTPPGKNPERRDRCLPIVLASAKSPYSETMAAIPGKTARSAKNATPPEVDRIRFAEIDQRRARGYPSTRGAGFALACLLRARGPVHRHARDQRIGQNNSWPQPQRASHGLVGCHQPVRSIFAAIPVHLHDPSMIACADYIMRPGTSSMVSARAFHHPNPRPHAPQTEKMDDDTIDLVY